jgi:hypothetical protein
LICFFFRGVTDRFVEADRILFPWNPALAGQASGLRYHTLIGGFNHTAGKRGVF